MDAKGIALIKVETPMIKLARAYERKAKHEAINERGALTIVRNPKSIKRGTAGNTTTLLRIP